MKKYSPIVLFVYNRPDHTSKTIEYLKKNEIAKYSELFIFSDGPKNEGQIEKVLAVRKIINNITGFKSVKIIESKENKGLANSVINGVTQIINEYGKVIVLEDDIITSKNFLKFMNEALDYYQNDSKIWSIGGYKLPFEIPKDYREKVFLTYRATSWGWATWKDRWNTIDWNIKDYKNYKFNILKIIHFCKGGNDLDKMLRNQMKGKIDSWAIRWCYNQSFQNKYTVIPTNSLIKNNGMDNSGTHCDSTAELKFNNDIDDNFECQFNRNLKLNKNILKKNRKIMNRSIIKKLKKIFK